MYLLQPPELLSEPDALPDDGLLPPARGLFPRLGQPGGQRGRHQEEAERGEAEAGRLAEGGGGEDGQQEGRDAGQVQPGPQAPAGPQDRQVGALSSFLWKPFKNPCKGIKSLSLLTFIETLTFFKIT